MKLAKKEKTSDIFTPPRYYTCIVFIE